MEGYAFAARRALVLLFESRNEELPWAQRTRRVDMVVGNDRDACDALIGRYDGAAGAIEFKPVTREKRFGSMLRKYVGERIGRVLLRPTWSGSPPPIGGDDVFGRWDAAARVDWEVRAYNEAKTLERPPVGTRGPPDAREG